MKQCHACGQKLPLKVGDIVEMRSILHAPSTGMVTDLPATGLATVTSFDGRRYRHSPSLLVRCHGYYRITERESMA